MTESALTEVDPEVVLESLRPPPQITESAPTEEVPVVESFRPPPQITESEVVDEEPPVFLPPPQITELPETPASVLAEAGSLQIQESAHTPPVPRKGSEP